MPEKTSRKLSEHLRESLADSSNRLDKLIKRALNLTEREPAIQIGPSILLRENTRQ